LNFNETRENPWDEGYSAGYSDGKTQGFLSAIEEIKEAAEFSDSEDLETKPFISRKKSGKVKFFTKFLEFNFHIPIKAKAKKVHPGPILLEKFLTQPLSKIKLRPP